MTKMKTAQSKHPSCGGSVSSSLSSSSSASVSWAGLPAMGPFGLLLTPPNNPALGLLFVQASPGLSDGRQPLVDDIPNRHGRFRRAGRRLTALFARLPTPPQVERVR